MLEVVLLYDKDCPNVADCRANLIKAFSDSNTKPKWREIDRLSVDASPKLRGYGSPTILVNGFDVAGQEPGSGESSCRLYQNEDGKYAGAPSVEQIALLLTQVGDLGMAHRADGSGWKETIAVLPAVAVALLPSITCPACWPGYAAVLSSFGIGFLPSNRYLLPFTVTFLGIYLLMLAWEARKRNHFRPFVLGTIGSVVLVAGRFAMESDLLLYVGVAILITASIWNAWPTIRAKWFASKEPTKGCSACSGNI